MNKRKEKMFFDNLPQQLKSHRYHFCGLRLWSLFSLSDWLWIGLKNQCSLSRSASRPSPTAREHAKLLSDRSSLTRFGTASKTSQTKGQTAPFGSPAVPAQISIRGPAPSGPRPRNLLTGRPAPEERHAPLQTRVERPPFLQVPAPLRDVDKFHLAPLLLSVAEPPRGVPVDLSLYARRELGPVPLWTASGSDRGRGDLPGGSPCVSVLFDDKKAVSCRYNVGKKTHAHST